MTFPFIVSSSNNEYQIQKSLRFRGAASAYMSKNFGIGSRTSWTLNFILKRGILGTAQILFATDNSNRISFGMNTMDAFEFECYNGAGADYFIGSSALLRDASSHYHLQVVWDSNNATATDRQRMYINGVRLTAFSSTGNTIPLGALSNINNSGIHNIGRSPVGINYFDGYISEFNFIDGQSLTPASFGKFDSNGNWVAKKYIGSYGTNGFYLDFTDTTSTTTLCYDKSGNNNHFTPTNISLTPGVTYDSMLDVPLSGGGAERGNYATLNRLSFVGSMALGNLRYSSSATHGNTHSTIGVKSGKWYAEAEYSSGDTTGGVGFATNTSLFTSYPGVSAGRWWVYQGFLVTPSGAADSASYTPTAGMVMRLALDYDNGKAWIGNASGWMDSALGFTGNPATGASPTLSFSTTDEMFFMFESAGVSWDANFGQRPFSYSPPAGFKPLHTGNLPEPSIRNPKKHFDVVTRIGTDGGSNTIAATISSLQFQPDLLWTKTRNSVQNSAVFDSIRTSGKKLQTNTTNAESTSTPDNTQTFISNGYVTGKGDDTNGSGITFVDWLWKAGGAPVANNAGSIASQVSANPQAGFSIATYTGNSANATVGHGLGVTPKLVIVKARTGSATTWVVYHKDANASPASGYLALNDTIAFTANASVWGNVEPTSSNFSVSNNPSSNASGINYVAYCFAEIPGFSRFGSYTGNGSATGTFVHCGFSPRYVMVKRIDSSGTNWVIFDAARSVGNPNELVLSPTTSGAESFSAGFGVDCVANGFKVRATDGTLNTNGGTYIFAAFAEVPFKYALAR